MIRIALSGDRGRMGQSLQKLIKKSSFMKVTNRANTSFSPKNWTAHQIDGVIDFSLPELFKQSLSWATQNKKAFVSGTTGLSSYERGLLKKASQQIPVFYSENMSRGIFLIKKWLKDLLDKDSQILIEDIHHKGKKDKPSGTALSLKKSLPDGSKERVKIKSFRRGKEFGTHRILIQNQREILLLEHKALNRELFAKGALQALAFILKKKKGYYSPADLFL